MEVFKDIEVLIRYVIPGYTILFPLALIIYFTNPEVGEFAGLVFSVFGICVGYFIQQTYMFLFEGKKRPFEAGGYASVEKGGRKRIITEVAKDGLTLTKMQAYLVWEYFIYSNKVTDALRSHISRSHAIIHSQRAASISCAIGVLIAFSGIIYLAADDAASTSKTITLSAVALAYAATSILLMLKAKQTRENLMEFEEFIVKKNWDDIKQILSAAEYLHETGRKK